MAAEVPRMIAEWEQITEGSATMLYPKGNTVFYNNVQQVNRDVSVAAISAFDELRCKQILARKKDMKREDIGRLKIFEALSATGLRSIRYANELSNVEYIVANDISEAAVELIRQNVVFNGLSSEKVIANREDAVVAMIKRSREHVRNWFDVIDLDPYGSASPFLDSAMASIQKGGLVCITCTDLSCLCGAHPAQCHTKYNAFPVRSKYCHEQALRIVLAAAERAANLHGKYIVPLASIFIDFYVRIFVQVFSSKEQANLSATKIGSVYQCVGCDTFAVQPRGRAALPSKGRPEKVTAAQGPPVGESCNHCGSKFKLAGPMWLAPIHDMKFVNRMIELVESIPSTYAAPDRVVAKLKAVSRELDVPLYYDLSQIANTLHCVLPPMGIFVSALINAGYEASSTHCNPLGIKTNAPANVIWDIMRCWVRTNPVKGRSETSPGTAILSKEPSLQADFTVRREQTKRHRTREALFLPNPEKEWGPKQRAHGGAAKRNKVVSTGQSGHETAEGG